MTRLFRNISIEDMAELLRIPAQDLADLEAGRKRFSAAQLVLVSHRLGVHIHFLFEDGRSRRRYVLKTPSLYLHFPANDNVVEVCAAFEDAP